MPTSLVKLTVRLTAGLALSSAVATAALASSDYTTASIITNVEPRETAIDIYLPQANNPMGCGTAGWFRLSSSAQNYAAIYSAILTQFARGGNIRLYANACDTDGASIVVAAWAF